MADFGQNRLWPNRLWPKPTVAKSSLTCCVFVCVCVFVCLCAVWCVVWVLVSRFHGVGFHMWVLVSRFWFGHDRPSQDRPSPGPPWLLCEALAAPAANSKRAHLSAPALQTPPKFHEKTPREGRKERIMWRERGRKNAKFWAPTLRGPHPSGPHPSGPQPSGPHPSGPHPLGPHTWAPTFSFWVWASCLGPWPAPLHEKKRKT